MDSLDKISYNQLIKEANEVYELLVTIVKVDKRISGLVSTSLIPFIAFTLDGLIKLGSNKVDLEFQRAVGKLRVGHKLLSDKKESKIKKMIAKNINSNYNLLTKDYNYAQKIFIKLFRQEDYGVYKYKDIDFFNTIQVFLYLDIINIDYSHNSSEKLRNLSEKLTVELLKCLGNNIKFTYKDYAFINKEYINFNLKDYYLYDKKRKNIFNNNLEIETQVLLHSHLCQLNFVGIVIPEGLNYNGDSLIRFQFIVYLEAIKILQKTFRKNPQLDKYESDLKSISSHKIYKILSKRKVRNNLAHYRLKGYDSSMFSEINPVISIIEYESMDKFNIFYEEFLIQYKLVQDLFKNILFDYI